MSQKKGKEGIILPTMHPVKFKENWKKISNMKALSNMKKTNKSFKSIIQENHEPQPKM